MRQTAIEWFFRWVNDNPEATHKEYAEAFEQAKEMEKQQLKYAYKHGRDDENCALSDGAMCPDYDNAEEWYQGEYGGDK